jgi:hypothetical protein
MNPRSSSPSSDAATGAAAFKLSPPPGVPKEVQASFLLWLTAVAAGVLETIIRIVDALLVGSASGSGGEADLIGAISNVVIRVIVYTLVVYITTRMRLGKRWAPPDPSGATRRDWDSFTSYRPDLVAGRG